LRCLFINDHIGAYGGVERYISLVSVALEKRGFEIAYLHTRIGQRTTAGRRQAWHVPDVEAHPRRLAGPVKERIREILDGWQPDVIFWHNLSHPGLLEFCLEIRPVVVFQHTLDAVCPGGRKFFPGGASCESTMGAACLLKPLYAGCASRRPWRLFGAFRGVRKMQSLMSRTAGIVVASEFMAGRLAEVGIPRESVEVIPLFASPRAFAAQMTDPESSNRLFCVGRFVPGKGQARLLEALRGVEQPFKLILAGEGPGRPELESLAAALPEGSVEMLDYLGEKRMSTEYVKAAFFVFPSILPEPFGLVGVEAMAHGRPVVAFGVGGVSEWLVPDGDVPTGVLVPCGDMEAFRSALGRMLSGPETVFEMGAAARRVAKKRFTLSRHAEKLLPLLQKAAKGKS
jgi:glycosyltransferase involved in cell wall biosynthesis